MEICGTNYDVDRPEAFCRQLIGVALQGPRAEAEAACLIALEHVDLGVRQSAFTAIGHSARVNRAIGDPLLNRALGGLRDPELRGYAQNALDDIAVFVLNDRGGWEAFADPAPD